MMALEHSMVFLWIPLCGAATVVRKTNHERLAPENKNFHSSTYVVIQGVSYLAYFGHNDLRKYEYH
jgi:hypothetical protein